jgi:hypothetical protein
MMPRRLLPTLLSALADDRLNHRSDAGGVKS